MASTSNTRGYSKAQLADLVRDVGLWAALRMVQSEQIDDGELYRWWSKAQTAINEIEQLVTNCQGQGPSSVRPNDPDVVVS